MLTLLSMIKSDGDWSVLVGEQADGLGSSVFIDRKRTFCESADVLLRLRQSL